jgi:hypothetical protein
MSVRVKEEALPSAIARGSLPSHHQKGKEETWERDKGGGHRTEGVGQAGRGGGMIKEARSIRDEIRFPKGGSEREMGEI